MPPIKQITFAEHKQQWVDCTRCNLCDKRKHVVLLRGNVPARMLFIGEAPGESEDVVGKPFVGPAGKLLDYLIERARLGERDDKGVVRGDFAATNLIACVPRDELSNKVHEPPSYAVEACAPRLQQAVRLVRPKIIVWVGAAAKKYGPKYLVKEIAGLRIKCVEIVHPSAILQAHITQQGMMKQKTIVALNDTIVF